MYYTLLFVVSKLVQEPYLTVSLVYELKVHLMEDYEGFNYCLLWLLPINT